MGEAKHSMNDGSESNNDNQSVEQIRAEIAETRDELSKTIDAIEAKLSPQHVKEQVKETLHDATVGNAQHLAQKARETFEAVAGAAMAKAQEVLQPSDVEDGMSSESPPTEPTTLAKLPESRVTVHQPRRDFSQQAKNLGDWLKNNPQAQRAIKGAALGAGAMLLIAMKRRNS